MKTLILYSSHDGQTLKIAEYIAQHLLGEISIEPLSSSPALESFERVIIGASVRYGHFDSSLYQYIEKNHLVLRQKKSAFFGVNLTARKLGKDQPETNVYVRKFLSKIIWTPDFVAVFAGALRYPRYKLFDRLMIKLIMYLGRGETDTSKDVEYTDWQKVENFARQFEQL